MDVFADLTVRAAGPADLDAVSAIYDAAARSSVATFDLEGPPLPYWQAKLDADGPGTRMLVAVDPAGAVAGFAYSGWFRPRPAYGATRETSIYLHAEARGQGLGRRLYRELLDLLRADGMHLAVAVVAQPNPASDALHRALGYEPVGTFDEVGHKFGRYVSTRWFQLRL